MKKTELKNIEQAINWVFSQFQNKSLFYGHGTDNAWDEAVRLVLHVMKLPADSGQEVLEIAVSPAQQALMQELVKKTY